MKNKETTIQKNTKKNKSVKNLTKNTISETNVDYDEVKRKLNQGNMLVAEPLVKDTKKEIIEKEKIITITKEWKNLQAQRNAKFGLLGKPKQIKKHKLLVANGDKFFIQKESDDEIIYNDDYNTRKQKQKVEKFIRKNIYEYWKK